MSSIQLSQQIQSLDINKNLVSQKKNTINIKVNDTSDKLKQDLLSSVQLDESIDLTEYKNPTTYTMLSSIDNVYASNVQLIDKDTEEKNSANVIEEYDINNESSGIYSFDEPCNLVYNASHSSTLSTIVFNNEVINIENDTLNVSMDSNKNTCDTLINSSNQPYGLEEINQNPIISSQNTTIDENLNNDENVILSKNINNNDSFIKNEENDLKSEKTSENVLNESNDNLFDIDKYQDNFNILKDTKKLNENFITAIENTSLIVNGHKIDNKSIANVLYEFKKNIPSLESRQLLSSYIGSNSFKKPFNDLLIEYPDLCKFKQVNPVIKYDIQESNNGSFTLNASKIAELQLTDNKYYQKYKSIGVKEYFVLYKDKKPELYYSTFVT